ncbi:uncharacterized protein [Anabrus simplex]|uniref:uncharacterized protein isoform X2 n=1 Tax=Anabrus simplex TaxID=316456 RepID=UPI0035A27B81
MTGKRKKAHRKKLAKKLRMLELLQRMKNKGNENTSPCTDQVNKLIDIQFINLPEDTTMKEDCQNDENRKTCMYCDGLQSSSKACECCCDSESICRNNGPEEKDTANTDALPVISEKRKNEFSPLKKAVKRSRTSKHVSSLPKKVDLKWPIKNSSTANLMSWLDAAEQMFVPSPTASEMKAKRMRTGSLSSREETSKTPMSSVAVKRTKSAQEPKREKLEETFESTESCSVTCITPIISGKRSRRSSLSRSLSSTERSLTVDECLQRPKKRNKSVSGLPEDVSLLESMYQVSPMKGFQCISTPNKPLDCVNKLSLPNLPLTPIVNSVNVPSEKPLEVELVPTLSHQRVEELDAKLENNSTDLGKNVNGSSYASASEKVPEVQVNIIPSTPDRTTQSQTQIAHPVIYEENEEEERVKREVSKLPMHKTIILNGSISSVSKTALSCQSQGRKVAVVTLDGRAFVRMLGRMVRRTRKYRSALAFRWSSLLSPLYRFLQIIAWIGKKGDRKKPLVGKGPVVSLDQLRAVKLRPRSTRRKSVDRNKSGNRLTLSPASSREVNQFTRVLRNLDTNIKVETSQSDENLAQSTPPWEIFRTQKRSRSGQGPDV